MTMKLLTTPEPTPPSWQSKTSQKRGLLPVGKSYRRLLQTLHQTKDRPLYLDHIDMSDVIDRT